MQKKNLLIIILVLIANSFNAISQELIIDEMYRIELLIQMKNYDSAINFTKKLNDSLKCERNEILGFCYRNLENYSESISYYEQYVQDCNPSYIQRVNLGDSYYKTKQLKKAKEQFLIVKNEMPDFDLINFNLGLIENDNGNKEKAVEYFTSAINNNKGETLNFDYVEMQITTLNELGKYDTAFKNIDIILNMWKKESIEYKYTLVIKSWIYGAKGEYKIALKKLDDIIKSGIENEAVLLEAYYYQFELYSKIKKKKKACDVYKKIKEIDIDAELAKEYDCE